MFWDDIVLVTEQIEKYGLRTPFVDLGGMNRPCIADYTLTRDSGIQEDRYIALAQRPFDHIDPNYLVLNPDPDKGDPYIEDLPYIYQNSFGTAVCLNVLEHVKNPFRVFAALYQIMKSDSLLIIETVFCFPYHPSPEDYWRFTPDCLKYLAEQSGFTILEHGWRMHVPVEWGVMDIQRQEIQQIKSVYITLTKDGFVPRSGDGYLLPKRYHLNGEAC